MAGLQTVVELPKFLRRAKAIMSDDERAALVDYVAANPEAGVSLGGGLRKVRVAREGSGKRGGYRIIFVFGGVAVVWLYRSSSSPCLPRTRRII